MHELVDVAELLHDRRREHEGIEVGLAHAAVEAVQGDGDRKPGIDQLGGALCPVRIEVDRRPEVAAFGDPRANPQTEGTRHLERVDDVQIVCPGLREVLPRVGARVAADEALLPVRGAAAGVVLLEGLAVVLPLVAEQGAEARQIRSLAYSRSQKKCPTSCRKWPSSAR